MLYVRMALYAICAGMTGYGIATFDPAAGTLTVDVEQLAQIIGGVGGFVMTFIASRFAKNR